LKFPEAEKNGSLVAASTAWITLVLPGDRLAFMANLAAKLTIENVFKGMCFARASRLSFGIQIVSIIFVTHRRLEGRGTEAQRHQDSR
jgi:hypothetical protein